MSKETFDVTKRLIFSGRNRFSRFTAMCQADCLRLIVKVSTLKADVLKFPQILIRSRAPFNESREIIQKKKLTWKIRSLTKIKLVDNIRLKIKKIFFPINNN